MPKVTKIKAGDSKKIESESDAPAITRKKVVIKDKKTEKNKRKEKKMLEKKVAGEKNEGKKPFILWRPVVYLWRYIKGSWAELRQVRWPNRKATWKMVLAVLAYTAIFMIVITLLDLLFKWLFGLALGN